MRFPLLVLAAALLTTGSAAGTGAFAAAERVPFASSGMAPGTIVVKTGERRLYLLLGSGQALRYTVGVGRSGHQWAGTSLISGKHVRPNWAPPDAVRADRPDLPDVIAGGSASNPMGEAALTLAGGEYAIHGTNAPGSIGGFVSYGCIRMFNRDIVDLYGRVRVGTTVVVQP